MKEEKRREKGRKGEEQLRLVYPRASRISHYTPIIRRRRYTINKKDIISRGVFVHKASIRARARR
jgi:hypothetical protein